MRIGISIQSAYRVSDPREGARFMVERAEAARQADLDSLFVGDHHVTDHAYYQNSPILGRMLAHWHDKPAGALYLLPLWHPVLLAEQVSTLAAIMPGRFIMQCGLGGLPHQSAGMGVDMSQRVAMFEDSLSIMRRLWAGETVSHDRFWSIENARIAPLASPRYRRMGWRFGAGCNQSCCPAGRRLVGQPEPIAPTKQGSVESVPSGVCGTRSSTTGRRLAPRCVHWSSAKAAADFKAKAVAKGYRGFAEDALLCGEVKAVAEQFAEFAEAGFTDIIVRNMASDQSDALATIEALSEVRRELNL